ncbi:uncharacterized protein LOC130724818 [Lotus japonicus]|uniref:uncharacterized protein LOC130724818 n=1 Tax=Lotus japonicus TaxID=34305 RepID=UPI0025860834|nr:uncharacterized protein LOC130724818 [Lotus japonicus]
MAKAYDRIEWDFLHQVLISMGFPIGFTQLILRCVSSVSYAPLINGEPAPFFSPHRGLRQGDPLSPYLFILCAEVLSSLLADQVRGKNLHGVTVARGAPMISHLFFADDSLIFGRATAEEADCILKVIKLYEQTSGQLVNMDKSEISFSRNVISTVKVLIQERMGVKAVEIHDKYLGLPTVIGRSKKAIFARVQERVWRKLQDWKGKTLSKAGKEVLLKSVAQSIPTYVMSCFKIPEGICHKIEGSMSSFWWGQQRDERKIHWISWRQLCKPKHRGGMGFRDLVDFNHALLAKQAWRLLLTGNSLLYRVLKARYFPRTSILNAQLGFQPSYSWRSIWETLGTVQEGLKWRVGDGKDIRIWHDAWLPGCGDGVIHSHQTILPQDAQVSSLILQESRRWNGPLIDQIFNHPEAQKIKLIPLSWAEGRDRAFWRWSRFGDFTVRSTYIQLQNKKVSNEASSSVGTQFPWKAICEWLEQGFRQQDEDWVVAVIQVLHVIWRARNNAYFNQVVADPGMMIQLSINNHLEWIEAQERCESRVDEQARNIRWEAPPQGVIKLNVDAGWSGHNSTGFGLVARSDRGELMMAATKVEQYRLDSLLAEAYAVPWCLQMASEMDLENVIVESDSLAVIHALRTGSCPPDIEAVIQDCKVLFSLFPVICFSHARRQANSVAHELAALASNFPFHVWWHEPPPVVAHALVVDSTYID